MAGDEHLLRQLIQRGWIAPADRETLERLRRERPEGSLLDVLVQAGLLRADQADQLVGATFRQLPPDGPTQHLSPGETLDPRPTSSRYALGRALGAGGMGEVLEAHDPSLGRLVAYKRMLAGPEGADRDQLGRFVREARITARLAHPNIVPVYELAADDQGNPYYTMKQIAGRTLADLLQKEEAGRPAAVLARRLDVFSKVCDAVAFAHSKGVIHRDLKPGNVMVGEFGEVLVLDWGLAKVLAEEDGQTARSPRPDSADSDVARAPLLTQTGAVLGTLAYMAPEQALGRVDKLDARSDVYSLGAILYEILVGQPPFQGGLVAVWQDVIAGKLVPPSRRAPERAIPWELEAVVLKAMARRQPERYPDVAALKADIEAYLAGHALEAVLGRRAGLVYRLGKWARRNRLRLAIGALLLAELVFALAWPYLREARERSRQTRIARAFHELARELEQGLERRIREASGPADLLRLAGELEAPARDAAWSSRLDPSAPPELRDALLAHERRRFPREALLARTHRRLGDLFEAEAGRALEAFRAYARAYRLAPGSPDGLHALLRLAGQHLEEERLATALAAFRLVYQGAQDPRTRQEALHGGAQALFSLGQFEDCIATLRAAGAPLPVRSRRILELAGRLRLRAELPVPGWWAAAGNLDGRPGDELLINTERAIQILTWQGGGFRLLRQEALEGAEDYRLAVGDLTGDGKPEAVILLRGVLQGGRPVTRLRIHGPLTDGFPLLFEKTYDREVMFTRLAVLDADGDGTGELYLAGQYYRRETRIVRWHPGTRTWSDELLDPRLGSDVEGFALLDDREQGRLLLVAAGPWNDFSIRAYQVARDGTVRFVTSQTLGHVLSLAVADLDGDGVPEIAAYVSPNPTHRIPPIFGDRLERLLPGGGYVLGWQESRFRPLAWRSWEFVAWVGSAIGTAMSPWRLPGGSWFAFDRHRRVLREDAARKGVVPESFEMLLATRIAGDPGKSAAPWFVPVRGIGLRLVADLDGDGVSEIVSGDPNAAMIASSVYGLGAPAGRPGAVLGGRGAGGGSSLPGEEELQFAQDLRGLGLEEEWRSLLEELARRKGTRAGAEAALELVDMELSRGRYETALSRGQQTIQAHPVTAARGLWKMIEAARAEGDFPTLRERVARLRALGALSPEALHRLRPHEEVLAALDALKPRVRLAVGADRLVITDPVLVRREGGTVRLRARRDLPSGLLLPLRPGAGAWRMRATLEVTRWDWESRLALGWIQARPHGRGRFTVQWIKQGGDWNTIELLGAGVGAGRNTSARLPEGTLARTGRFELEILAEPAERNVWVRLVRAQDRKILARMWAAPEDLPAAGDIRFGIESVLGEESGPFWGEVLIHDLVIETAEPAALETSMKILPEPEAVAARALLDRPDELEALFRDRLAGRDGTPAWRALQLRYYGLTAEELARLAGAFDRAARGRSTGDLVGLTRSAMEAGRDFEALLAVEALARRGASVETLPLNLLARLRWWERILPILDAWRGAGNPAEDLYLAGLRGQALLELEKFEAAEKALAAGLARARAAGAAAADQIEAVEALLRKARWKRQVIAGTAPEPDYARYRQALGR